MMKKMKQKTRGQWERAVLVLSLLIPTIIMLALFVINRIYPFGDRSFLFSDMYHQYMPFFSELLHKVRGGESLSFSFNVGIGSNFLALFVYYLASPFHIFSLLVPESHLMEFMSYLIVLKIGLAGLTSYLYLKKHFQAEDAKDVGDAPESLWTKKRGSIRSLGITSGNPSPAFKAFGRKNVEMISAHCSFPVSMPCLASWPPTITISCGWTAWCCCR